MDDRPPRAQRLLSDRSVPAVITIRTHFDYTTPPGRPPRVARFHSHITNSGEFGNQTTHYEHVGDVFQRMIAAFGDDADLEVVVQRTSGTLTRTAPAVQKGMEIPHDGIRGSEV